MSLTKRLLILGAVVALFLGGGLFFTMDVIKFEWLSFMEVQPSYRPMEEPLPLPARAVPVEGAAYIPGMGAPVNPVEADEVSLTRGKMLYDVHCALCHGAEGRGDGVIAAFLQERKPADLTADSVQTKSDGALFLVISNGTEGGMPALNENLTVRERWDVVNYVRTLKP